MIRENVKNGVWQISKRKKKFHSPVWNYIYEVYDDGERIADTYYCKICHKGLYNSYQKGNTSLFVRHSCISDENGVKQKMIIRPETKKEFKDAAADFVAIDLRPAFAVHGKGLLKLLDCAMKFGQNYRKATLDDLRHVMPSRNCVTAHLEEKANDIKAKIKSILQGAKEVGSFAVTSDTWTDNHRRLTYICLVAHCNIITENGIEKHRFTLYVDQITELIKTKEVIVKYILKVLGEYGFSEEEVKQFVTFVTDRGSNFKYGLISSGFSRHNCYAHLIHNLIKAMLTPTRVKEMIKTAAKITAFVKKTNINSQMRNTIKSFSKTRWNGAQTMLESIVVNFNELYDLLYHRQRRNPKETCFDSINSLNVAEVMAVSKFLKQFTDVINDIEGDSYETLSMVWPIFETLKSVLEEDVIAADHDILNIVEDMKVAGMNYFTTRYDDFKPTMKHKIGTVLNPNFKHIPQTTELERKNTYAKIAEYISEPIDESRQTLVTVSTVQNLTKINPFFRSFYRVDEADTNTPKPSELDLYLQDRVTMQDINITKWWNEHRKEFPKLFKLFAKISCIPASSASAEGVFSRTGLVVNDRRSLILPKNVNNIILSRNQIEN